MEVTLLGTGSPAPNLNRAGTALTVSTGEKTFLVDCGPRTVYELLRNGIDPGSISELLFTHHHVDHNAAFPHFAISSWTAGRESLRVYGPDGTDDLIEALYNVYEEDLAYRQQVGYDATGIEDIEWIPVEDGSRFERGDVEIEASSVEHSIETYAYRFEGPNGERLVFSGDTRKSEDLAAFAAGADVLVHDAHMSPVGDPPTPSGDELVWDRYLTPYPEEMAKNLQNTHCTPRQAGEVASNAGVDTLVLTHFPPYRDTDGIRAAAAEAFDGTVIVAYDGLTIDVSNGSLTNESQRATAQEQL
ncbi:MBL fold metallo-hydrolase [Halobellus sp. Atlit-38R]|uniref:MBL fold metallo-hydrolase n=1 Tax=Halobellus sp. Atlit-38R TaxID=2282131 RepID=UPI000EF20431|nr:MBL fold metallo-hydrolase [Halobellus sp. Atlit-38R]RLM90334.1 MBL fold metallo-hydrolase [Halobellus sp. Atlit-38R]